MQTINIPVFNQPGNEPTLDARAGPSGVEPEDYPVQTASVIERRHFQALLDALATRGYRLVGPTRKDGAIVYDDIRSVYDLPEGWTDEQAPGKYRLKQRNDKALFGYTLSPQSWKRFLQLPSVRFMKAHREGKDWKVTAGDEAIEEAPKTAFIGVRACELNAIDIQDRVFMRGTYAEPSYKARRQNLFVVAVNCGVAGGTCFCSSMGTGPRAASGYDLALTEVLHNEDHYFVVNAGTQLGEEVLADVPHRPAFASEIDRAGNIIEQTARQTGRTLDTDGIKEMLYANYESPIWDSIAERCLACGNCTSVCPTCFCATVEDVTSIDGQEAERWWKWDSCFTMGHSYIHGGSIRNTRKSRYRQWMTHKFASWIDQFGTSGCVGCGRCITWCPVGIDVTEELGRIRTGYVAKDDNLATATSRP